MMSYDLSCDWPKEKKNLPFSAPGTCLGLAARREMCLDKECPQRHAEVFVGLIEAQLVELQLSLRSIYLT